MVEVACNLGFHVFNWYCVTAAKLVDIETGHLGLKLGYFARFQSEYVLFNRNRKGASALHAEIGLWGGGKSEDFIDFVLKLLRFLATSGPFANVTSQLLDLFLIFRACCRRTAGVNGGNNDALKFERIILGNVFVVVGFNFLLGRVAVFFIQSMPV